MKHVIWQDIDIDIDDWKDFLEEEYPEVTDEYEQYNLCYEMNAEYLKDEKANLCKDMNEPIVVIANFGLWDGKHEAWAIFNEKQNLADVLDAEILGMNCDMQREYYVHNGDVRAKVYHHDGGNYYTFRKLRSGLTDGEKEKINDHEVDYSELMRMTESLAPEVCKVYGWEECDC